MFSFRHFRYRHPRRKVEPLLRVCGIAHCTWLTQGKYVVHRWRHENLTLDHLVWNSSVRRLLSAILSDWFRNSMASLAQNVDGNPGHVPWNNKNTIFEGVRQNMLGFSSMKDVYEHTPYLHGREKYYYCTRYSGASPTRKSASQPKKNLINK